MDYSSKKYRPHSLSVLGRQVSNPQHVQSNHSKSPSSQRKILISFSKLNLNPLKKSQNIGDIKDLQKSLVPRKNSSTNSLNFSPRINIISPRSKLIINKPSNSASSNILVPKNKLKIESRFSVFNKAFRKSQLKPKKKLKNLDLKLAFKIRTGTTYGKPKKNNQDNFFIIKNFADCKDLLLAGVMDGHGIYGHEVSKFVKVHLPNFIENNFPYDVLGSDKITEDSLEKIKKSINLGFLNTQKNLISKRNIDINYSGTTAISVLIKNRLVVCGNVGDSRAVIGRFSGEWIAVPLSTDHKLDLPNEKERVLMCGGRVEPFQEEDGRFVGPQRVWMQREQLPGLGMSRSIGDLVASRIGVISEPEIRVHRLKEEDKFLVMASDGIWEFISSDEAVGIVSKFYDQGGADRAAEELIGEAVRRWEEEDCRVDDITLIVIFFNHS